MRKDKHAISSVMLGVEGQEKLVPDPLKLWEKFCPSKTESVLCGFTY